MLGAGVVSVASDALTLLVLATFLAIGWLFLGCVTGGLILASGSEGWVVIEIVCNEVLTV